MASILEIILKTIKQGTGIPQTEKELTGLQKAIAQAKAAMSALGIAFGVQQGYATAKELADTARAANDAKGALTAAAEGMATYTEAIEAGKTATQGMVSETQLASSLSTIFGAGLAKNATEAAQLANAGTILSNVFASAGASQELYVRLLSSGSIQLFNNFGITNAMVQAKQREIEATTGLTGEEARLAAIKATLIANAQKYQSALSDDTRAAAQFQASIEDAKAALGQFILPEFTDAMVNFGGAVRGTADALDDMNPALRGAVEGFINISNPLSAANQLIEDYNNLAGDAAPTAEELAAGIQETGTAATAAAPAIDNYVSSIYGIQVQAMDAARAQEELNAAIYEQSEASAQSAALAGTMGGGMDAFTQNRLVEGFQAGTDAGKKYRNEQENDTKQAARQMTTAFTKAADDIGNIIGGKLQTTFQDVFQLPEGSADQADEPARRLATVAAAGFGSEWLTQLSQQFAGQSFWTPIATAIQSGNQEELKAAAVTALQQFSQGLIPQLWDVEVIKSQVRAQMTQQNIKAQLIETVKKELGAEGVGAAVGMVELAAGNVAVATDTTSAAVTGMQTTAETAGTAIQAAFSGTLPALDTIIARLNLMAGLIERVGALAQGAASGISAMNPPTAPGTPNGIPSDAQQKMGGTAPL